MNYALPCTLLLLLTSVMPASAKPINESRAISANEQVEITIPRGKITLQPSDEAQITISGELDDNALRYQFDSSDGVTLFRVELPRQHKWGDHPGSTLTITLPRNARLSAGGTSLDITLGAFNGPIKLNSVSGDIVANAVAGELSVETVSGDIRCNQCQGNLTLETVSGDIDDKDSSGELRYRTVSGDINMRSKAARITLDAVSGDIDAELDGSQRIRISLVNGDLGLKLLNSRQPELELSTVNGDADLYLPSDIDVRVNAQAMAGGDISNKLSAAKAEQEEYGPASSLVTRLGAGTGKIEMTTVNGDLNLKKYP